MFSIFFCCVRITEAWLFLLLVTQNRQIRPFAFSQLTLSKARSLAVHLDLAQSGAKNKGLFAKHGIDMSIKPAGGIAQPVPALISGDAQFAVTGTGMSVNSTVEGGRMINIAKIVGYISVWVVGKPGTLVNSMADLKGKTIATLKYPSNTIIFPNESRSVPLARPTIHDIRAEVECLRNRPSEQS